uniref:Lytic transglycosylase, catalytic n=1 Tax=mine drainage metagenome TaxID=410659 RepID=E6QRE8_9ZZZZ
MARMSVRTCVFIFLALIYHVSHADDNQVFLAAREAFRAGQAEPLALDAYALRRSVLAPYLDYWQLRLRLKSASNAEIANFITSHADSPLSQRLHAEWLQQLGQQQDWNTYLAEYANQPNPDSSLQCYAWQARNATTPPAKPAAEAIMLWQAGKPLPPNCYAFYGSLFANKSLSAEDAWLRARQALLLNDVATANAAFSFLPNASPFNPAELKLASKDPVEFLNTPHDMRERTEQELVRYAVVNLAQQDAQAAAVQWTRLQNGYPELAREAVWGAIGLHGSLQHLPGTLKWFSQSDDSLLSDETLAWKARAALLAGDWPTVHSSILAMSKTGQSDPAWRYWLARSDLIRGEKQKANLLLLPLSREFNFYGLLAEEELGPVVSKPAIDFSPSTDDIHAIHQLPGIRRAILLYHMDLRADAHQEWRWATRSLDDRQLLAAAELARQEDWLDCAINTADRTRDLHNFGLRFLAPYRDVARSYAEQYGLNEAWVYGLIRQESRFISRAHSGVGASGLMQIMPNTAHWIARKLGIRHFHYNQLIEPDTSLKFGMYYLKTIQQRLGNSDLLATAAYNAGPNRALRWRTEPTIEGAIYAETIPFTETRDYVKKVFANTIFYARSFNQPNTSLKARLGGVSLTNPAPCINNTDTGACADIP